LGIIHTGTPEDDGWIETATEMRERQVTMEITVALDLTDTCRREMCIGYADVLILGMGRDYRG
jgi:hypothetical protein